MASFSVYGEEPPLDTTHQNEEASNLLNEEDDLLGLTETGGPQRGLINVEQVDDVLGLSFDPAPSEEQLEEGPYGSSSLYQENKPIINDKPQHGSTQYGVSSPHGSMKYKTTGLNSKICVFPSPVAAIY